MINEKDLYKILQVSPTANQQEISRAYKKLAKKYHPDLGGDEELFKEITLAYSILSDISKRKQYDLGTSQTDQFFFIYPHLFNDQFKLSVLDKMGYAFFKAEFADDIYIQVDSIDQVVKYTAREFCPHCEATGIAEATLCVCIQSLSQIFCSYCNSTGRLIQRYCKYCRGKGYNEIQRKIKVSDYYNRKYIFSKDNNKVVLKIRGLADKYILSESTLYIEIKNVAKSLEKKGDCDGI